MSRLYLVTGGGGFLGMNILEQLVEKGERVRTLELPSSKALDQIPKEVELVKGDLMDDASLDAFFAHEPDDEVYVLHIASVVYLQEQFSSFVHKINVEGTQRIIDWCIKNNVKKLVYCGSTSTIPELPNNEVMYEIDDYDPSNVRGCYASTKAKATSLVIEAAKSGKLDACACLPSGIFGPNDYSGGPVATYLPFAFKGMLPVAMGGHVSFCDVRDLADGFIKACDKGRCGESYNFAGPVVDLKDVFGEASRIGGHRDPFIPFPVPALKAVVPLMDIFFKVQGKSNNLMSNFILYQMTCNLNYSYEKAQKELGYEVRPYQETLKDMYIWFQEIGKI